jgi:hypothetical protein
MNLTYVLVLALVAATVVTQAICLAIIARTLAHVSEQTAEVLRRVKEDWPTKNTSSCANAGTY